MKSRWIPIGAGLIILLGLVLSLLGRPQTGWAYANHNTRGDWRVGGPHRTINALALEKYIQQAKSDPILSKYDFNNDTLKVQGPTIGEPDMFTPGREEKMETFRWWVTEGGYTADEPELYASFRHFYDPRHAETGQPPYLTDHLNEAGNYFKVLAALLAASGHPVDAVIVDEIGRNPEVDARDWAINGTAHAGWGENDYSWNKGLEAMQRAFESTDPVEKSKAFAQAWRALGETMHLLGDMVCPPHVRNDSHPAYAIDWSILPPELRNPNPNEGFLKGDAYETWVTEKVIKAVGHAPVEAEMQNYLKNSREPLDLFDRVALFTNASVFSSDTISGIDVSDKEIHSANGMPDYPSPRLDPDQYDPQTGYYTKRIGDREVCLAHRSWLSEIGWGSGHPRITYKCALSQAELLVPVGIAGNARLLEWFVPRVKVEISQVNVQNRTVRGTFTHEPAGAYQTALKFNTAAGALNRLYLNGTAQDAKDYQLKIENGVLTVTYSDQVAQNIDSLRQAGGGVVLSVMIDVGGLGIRSNDFPLTPITPTPSPTPTATPELTAPPAAGGDWVLQAIIPSQEVAENGPCYFDHQATIGDGSFVSSGSWTDQGCVEGGSASGSVATTCTWSPPPSYLKPGQEVTLTASCQGTAQQTGGDRSMGGQVGFAYTVNPPADCLTCFMTWSKRIFLVGVNDWTSKFPLSAAQTSSFTVPDGTPGDVLTIVADSTGPGGHGIVVYKYVSGATEPPPERTPPPEPVTAPDPATPTAPPPTATPTPTAPPPTATPTPTATLPPESQLPSEQDTLAPPPGEVQPGSQPQPSYGPVTFSRDFDYGSMQPLEPGYDFANGTTTLYATWPYRGVTAGTQYEYEWYRNGQLIEVSGNVLINAAGSTFDIYVSDPGAQQPLNPGNYVYRVKINGQPILSAECLVR